jgi:cyclohexyl-isocyanide hydratase
VAAEVRGQDAAAAIQLGLEYDPEPPWPSGTPERADPRLVEAVRARFAGWRKKREEGLAALAFD